MNEIDVTIKMDERLKREMEDVCEDLGLTLDTALNIFAKKMVREKRIPFEVAVDSHNEGFYSDASLARLREAIDAIYGRSL